MGRINGVNMECGTIYVVVLFLFSSVSSSLLSQILRKEEIPSQRKKKTYEHLKS